MALSQKLSEIHPPPLAGEGRGGGMVERNGGLTKQARGNGR